MGLFEWIGIGSFVVILIAGLSYKLYIRKKVKKIEAFRGISVKKDTKGKIE